MEKLYITEEIANHPANEGKGLEVGSEFEVNSLEGCTPEKCAETEPEQLGRGHWSCVLGQCVWVPEP